MAIGPNCDVITVRDWPVLMRLLVNVDIRLAAEEGRSGSLSPASVV
jgi:hypothetical protein